ncbi:hypothetical protein TNCV_1474921 [Trichonephila clavipes]|nr:hypothetical protein TNCV_1474921 [Trichonephila clavipes]
MAEELRHFESIFVRQNDFDALFVINDQGAINFQPLVRLMKPMIQPRVQQVQEHAQEEEDEEEIQEEEIQEEEVQDEEVQDEEFEDGPRYNQSSFPPE